MNINKMLEILKSLGVSEQKLNIITSIDGYNEETMIDVLYAHTGYKCNLKDFNDYQLDYELLNYEADEISKHVFDYYSFNNLELALAVFNYIEKDYCNATIHFYNGQHICCSDIARRKLRSKMISWRNDIIKNLTDINEVIDMI